MTVPSGGGVSWETDVDLVVVGNGVAGLSAAIAAGRRGLRVLTVAKGGPDETATRYAQGGIAIPFGRTATDAVESHVLDTCEAGAGLCDPSSVRSVVSGGPDALAALESLGAVFDRSSDGAMSRTREGGHSSRRIVHSGGDATGAEVQRALTESAGAVLYWTTAVRVLIARGEVVGLLVSSADGLGVVHCPAVLLATGGLGQLYSCSTNPPGATADGIALALDAGAEVADLEFVQFHPTVLFAADSIGRRPLVSEAVRGEGAHLVDDAGVRFMTAVHPLGDLAPRDVVSRAIAERLHLSGADHVFLDARSISNFQTRFPTVTASCIAVGLDPLADLIPVAPAAHYSCGGVVTDAWGRTSVPGLLAAGEVARTGVHGANRLASNSLLEGLVVGKRAGVVAQERLGCETADVPVELPASRRIQRAALQQLMTDHVGVVRDAVGLRSAASTLESLNCEPESGDGAGQEDAALTITASALVMAASLRRESRGCHTRRDYPLASEDFRGSIRVRRDPDGTLESVFDRPSRRVSTARPIMTGAN